MKLAALETRGVRNLADGTWSLSEDLGVPRSRLVITGPSGVGLTTWLEAIAATAARLSTAGPVPDAERFLDTRGSAATIKSTWWLDADERRYAGLAEERTHAEVGFRRGALAIGVADPGLLGVMSRYDHRPSLSKVVLIPALRNVEPSFTAQRDFEADQRRSRLAPGGSKYAGLARAVAQLHRDGDKQRFERIAKVFARLCQSARLVGVSRNGLPELDLGGGGRVTFDRLGLAELNAFVFATLPTLCGLERSVILVDTPELGLPAGTAARWLDVLQEDSPEAQWIVASRDAAVVDSVKPEERCVLERKA